MGGCQSKSEFQEQTGLEGREARDTERDFHQQHIEKGEGRGREEKSEE